MSTLADLIARASVGSQVIVTTHSERLTDELRRRTAAAVIDLARRNGATVMVEK